MGTVHEKLDEAMAEIEKLRKEYQIKAESAENLKRAYDEQVMKIHDASSKADKLTMELSLKEDELSAAMEICEELKSNLKDKESAIKSLSSANDRLRADSDETLKKFEEDNGKMVMALDEANTAKLDQEKLIESLRNEIERLRELANSSQRISSENEEKTKAFNELRRRDDVLLKLEEENRNLEDQLKWKKEQFTHLVEAHENIKAQFRDREKEWEKEKDTFFDEISTLQSKLDSQTRISEDLHSRLQMCNHALANEETRRKFLEIQLSESKTSFDNVSAEYEVAKSRIDRLATQRDKEIANLRDMLGTRETIYKETEYRLRKLEQENTDLMASLKELQESGIIKESGQYSSVSKLRKNLKTKESQWASQLEGCKSELKNKETLVTELQNELQSCHSLMLDLTLKNEETYVMLLVLKSHLSEKNISLVKAEKDLEDEREKVAILSARFESSNSIEEEEHIQLQIEVDALKEILKESSAYQEQLKEHLMKTEIELKEAQDALDRANEELAESVYEGNEFEFELQVWRSVSERLKYSLDENLQMRKKVEASLFAQMDIEFDLRREKDNILHILAEKERDINELKQQILSLQTTIDNSNTVDLHQELVWLRKELEGAILAQEEAERSHEKEKESSDVVIEKLIEEKAKAMEDAKKLSSDREMLLNMLMGISARISQLSMEDMELTKKLGKIIQTCDSSNEVLGIDMKMVDEFFDPVKENLNMCPSPTKVAEAAILEERSPLRALNN